MADEDTDKLKFYKAVTARGPFDWAKEKAKAQAMDDVPQVPRELGVTLALERWRVFLAAYAAVEPGNALDLEGDPPLYVKALLKEYDERP